MHHTAKTLLPAISTFSGSSNTVLGGKRFSDNEEVKVAMNSWLSDQVADFFEEGFQDLVLRFFSRLLTHDCQMVDSSLLAASNTIAQTNKGNCTINLTRLCYTYDSQRRRGLENSTKHIGYFILDTVLEFNSPLFSVSEKCAKNILFHVLPPSVDIAVSTSSDCDIDICFEWCTQCYQTSNKPCGTCGRNVLEDSTGKFGVNRINDSK
ncbi:hypothetical protein TNCV_3568671 [Trichonephila clavipes]|nr:hypothetical protein TNCV_3568671 [Trichonephila clavipes]